MAYEGANTTLALPGFYCKNKGHLPSYVPFLSVNDGVCDYDVCCDGSDEWAQVGGISCPDKCKEVGKEWKKQDEQRRKAMGGAVKKRKELVVEALRLRQEIEDQIQNLGVKVEASEVKVKALEEQLAEVERKEAGKVVKSFGKGSKFTILATLAKDRIEELREFLIDIRSQRDQGRDRIAELEMILTTFKEEYNPNFNDEGVKRAVRSWEEYAARDKPDVTDAAHERDLDEVSKADSETSNINWNEWQDTNENDADLRKYGLRSRYVCGANLSKSINLKNISLRLCAYGLTRNFGIYVSSLSIMAFSRLRELPTQNLKRSLMLVTRSRRRRTTWRRTRSSSRATRTI